MRKTLIALALLLSLAFNATSQSNHPAWLLGTWEGTGYQTDSASTWAMRLTAERRTFLIEYPSLNCGGKWKLVYFNRHKARFKEQIEHGRDRCVVGGNVVIEKLGKGQVLFLYSNPGSRLITASAVLNKNG